MFIGLEDPVFLTSGCGVSVFATSIVLVRAGRAVEVFIGAEEERDFVLSIEGCEAAGGWFIGRLDVCFITPGLSCADAPMAITAKKTKDKSVFFFKFFKTSTPFYYFGRKAR
jgi:hypothetical protein